MITKTNRFGERVCKVDNDIIEIENNLNLEILRRKKLEELKSEKRVDIEIKEAPQNLESDEEYNEEEEKNIDELAAFKARSGTEYVQIHQELRPSVGGDQVKIPYVKKKVFLKAKAHFTLPSRTDIALTMQGIESFARNFELSVTLDGPTFLPVVTTRNQAITMQDFNQASQDENLESMDYSGDVIPHQSSEKTHIAAKNQYSKVEAIDDEMLPKIQQLILENRDLFSPSVMAAEIDYLLYDEACKTKFSNQTKMKKFAIFMNIIVSTLTKMTIYPTDENFETSKAGLLIRYTVVSLFSPLFVGYVVGYRRGIMYGGNLGLFIYSGVGLVCAIVTYILLSKRGVSGVYKYIFRTVGAFNSFLWLFMLSDMVVSIIVSLNVLFNYKYGNMMLSVLSFWTWIPVIVSSIKVVRLMKAMPSFGVVMFNSFLVFGLATIVQCFLHGPQEINIWPESDSQESIMLSLYLGLNTFVIILIFGSVKLRGNRYSGLVGIFLVGLNLILAFIVFIWGIFFVKRQ